MTQVIDLLEERLRALANPADDSDWDAVRRARRRPLRLAVAGGALALAGVVGVGAALGLYRDVLPFGSLQPAPAPVVRSFSGFDVGAPAGMAPGVIAGEARKVVELRLSTGKNWILWVAPTRSGGFCMQHGCDRDRAIPFSPGLAVPGPVSPTGEILAPPVIFEGDTLIHGASKLRVEFEDGTSARTPLVWVSAPIDAGFFVYEVPEAHWAAGHRPVALVLEDANGKELARNTMIARGLAQLDSGRLH
jgi:hypothetical protein